MDDDHVMTLEIEELAIELGKAIVNASSTMGGAMSKHSAAAKLVRRRVVLGMSSPVFVSRAAAYLARKAEEETERLDAGLKELGIGSPPICGARSNGGD